MTLQIGVIGCGAIGQDHIRRLTRTLSGARVVAVNDIDPQQARDAVSKYGLDAEIYGDGHEVVAAADVQAVLVTSWGRRTKRSCSTRSRMASPCSARSRSR